MSISN